MPERVGRAGNAERDAKLNAIGETVERVEHRCRADEPEALIVGFRSGSLIATVDDSTGMLVLEWVPAAWGSGDDSHIDTYRLEGVKLFSFTAGFSNEGVPEERSVRADGLTQIEELFGPRPIPFTYSDLRPWPRVRVRRPWWDPRGWPRRVWDYLTGADLSRHPYAYGGRVGVAQRDAQGDTVPVKLADGWPITSPEEAEAGGLNVEARRMRAAQTIVRRTVRLGDEDIEVEVTEAMALRANRCNCLPYEDLGPYGHEPDCPADGMPQAEYNAARDVLRDLKRRAREVRDAGGGAAATKRAISDYIAEHGEVVGC